MREWRGVATCAGRSCSAASSGRTHATNPPASSNQVAVVVRQTEALDVAQAGAASADAAASDTAVDVGIPIAAHASAGVAAPLRLMLDSGSRFAL